MMQVRRAFREKSENIFSGLHRIGDDAKRKAFYAGD